MKRFVNVACLFIVVSVIGVFQLSLSQAQSLTAYDYTDQLIVKYRDPSFARTAVANASNADSMINEQVNALSDRAGVALTHFRFMSGNGHVLKLPWKMTLAEATAVARKLAEDYGVEYAEPDVRMFPMFTPNDPQYANQWHYKAPATEIGGANLPAAWDMTTGSASIVVAVIDTGIRPDHVDLVGRTVQGYDFISDALVANDGGGRDSNPSDPGDWITAAEDASGYFAGCGVEDSSWHGTHVAGTIGASTNNSIGVAGINWTSKILPVRVLGKCGGDTSDIVDGMSWAAGLAVPGVPANANPAKVLNLSLGGHYVCNATWQNAITAVTAAGATVVVSAGNSNLDASGFSPASCTGVISVAATNRAGGRSYYSNYGTSVKIAAPGGAWSVAYDPNNSVLSTLNSGTTTPVASPGGDIYQYYQGTSMAAPHVSGIASLMLSLNPALTPAQVLSYIQSTARTFPTGTGNDCTTSLCGSGIIDAAAAANSVASSTPDEYVTDVKRGVMIYSNIIQVSRVQGAPISITGGSYSINRGPYTKTKGKVNSGDTVTMRLESSRSYCTTKKATLSIGGGGSYGSENATLLPIGGESYIFSVTTRGPNGTPCK